MHDILSVTRITTLGAAVVVALSGGTNYVFSAYAPQLAERLNINHTRLNVIGIAGNVGVYSSAPVWGRIADTKGPRGLFVVGFVFLTIGYSGIRYLFDNAETLRQSPPSWATTANTAFYALVVFSFLTGAGGNSGFTSAVNVTAKTFPDRARATATGIVISGFGLSAFVFSTIAHAAYAGNTSDFLLLLQLGTAFPMLILGWLFVKVVPREVGALHLTTDTLENHLPSTPPPQVVSPAPHSESSFTSTSSHHRNNSRARLLFSLSDAELESVQSSIAPRKDSEVNQNRWDTSNRDISGWPLFKSLDFWLLFVILALLSGTGLMYINNVGSISQALYAHEYEYDPIKSARWQAAQVSTISLMNCAGRILIGLTADTTKTRYNLPRSICLALVSFLFLVSQLTLTRVTTVDNLWMASVLVGLSHGSVFGLWPVMCVDWFGLPHFSENWGYVALSPLIGGNVFSIAFGRNFDAHEHQVPPSSESEFDRQCMEGVGCYVASVYLTAGACLLALLLSLYAAARDFKRGNVSMVDASPTGEEERI